MWFSKSIPSVTAADAAKKVGTPGAVLVDVRSQGEFASGHAKGAHNCPLPTLSDCLAKLQTFSEVYVICQSGGRSSAAVSSLLAQSINAINVEGGTSAWRALGLPTA